MGDTIAQTRFENVSKHSNDSLLAIGNTLRNDKDKHKLDELMALCTNLQKKVLDLEKRKTTQQNKIDSLKRRVKKLEKKRSLRTHKLKRLYKVGLTARVESSGDEEDVRMHPNSTAATTVTITIEEITLAQALEALKTSKLKGIMIEEPVKLMKKKDLIRLDEEVALKLQVEIDADHLLAERLQAQEQEELSDAEKATLFQQPLEKRKKNFAAKRAEEQRNKPPTQAQQRKIMCNYLKNMEGYKLKDLKSKGFDSIQEMFDRAFKRVNTFEDFRTKLMEGKEKRAGTELIQENVKKKKVDDDKETAEIKKLMEIIPDEEEVTIDAIPLAVKSPSIVDWK
ncbi:hypothetical protein Tco_1489010, partial [Tanacetum coccineum]